MISEIDISQLGIIESARLELEPGLTTVTGETGAGKTMVLTAIGLLLGQRADAGSVRVGATRAEVGGVFTFSPENIVLSRILDENDIEVTDNELYTSRTVLANGRSRARLQGRPVPANILSEVAQQVVTIHGQSDQISLKSANVQRQILDRFGGSEIRAEALEYENAWGRAVAAKKNLDKWLANADLYELEAESLREGCALVAALNPAEDEEEKLAMQIDRLTHVTDLRARTLSALNVLRQSDSDGDAVSSVGHAINELRQAQNDDSTLGSMAETLEKALIDLNDVADQLADYGAGLEADPRALSQAHERRAELTKAMRGRATTVRDLLTWAEQAQDRLELISDVSATSRKLENELHSAQQAVLFAGEKLSKKRASIARHLSDLVTRELTGLAMGTARFEVVLDRTEKPKPYGLDEVKFCLQPHPEAPLRPVSQGASGGELSRVMLALEVSLAQQNSDSSDHTFIFDEVDSGIGGQAAVEVGARLASLAKTAQVIVVTHIPQVAAFADHHILVSKSDNATVLKTLNHEERATELARMLSGNSTPEVARSHALELMKAARNR